MKAQVFVVLLFLPLLFAQPTPLIWTVTGGQVGVGSCYDIVTESITFPAFTFHYATDNTIDVRGTTYSIPDEVFGYSSPVFRNDSRIFIMDSFEYFYNEYISSWGVSAGITIDGVTLNFAFSHTQGQINQYLNNSINYFADNILTWSEFELILWPGSATLNPHFLYEVNQLPQNYDPNAYLTFIQEFGTHIITKASYGASINFTSVFSSDLVDKETINWVSNQIKLSISWMQFNAGFNWNDFNNNTLINNTFVENAQNVTTIQGGQPDVLKSDGFKAWFQTVLQDYAVIFATTQVEPIYKVIPDPTIAANMKAATIAYGTGKLKAQPRPVDVVINN